MIVSDAIVGHVDEPRFSGRTLDRLPVTSRDAERRRLHSATESGREVRIDFAEPLFLSHGAVIWDDGTVAITIDRVPEQALVIRLAAGRRVEEIAAEAVRVGHALGNQHLPIEVEALEIRVPITTSPGLALELGRAAAPASASVALESVRLGKDDPIWRRESAHSAHRHTHGTTT